MRLCFSPTSPYVRKVRACAITREIDRLIELVPTDANASLPEFVAINPLSKVPALVTDDGVALFDSPVICEYLDSIGDALPMFPEHGALRWRALKFQAMGDGILDASVPRRGEMMKPQDEGRAAWIARQKAAVDRTLVRSRRIRRIERSISVRSRSPAHSAIWTFASPRRNGGLAMPALPPGMSCSRRTQGSPTRCRRTPVDRVSSPR